MTSMASPKFTSLPGSAGGRTPPASLDGPMTDLFGQALAPANRSRSRAKEPELLMQGICGPTFTDSSVPDGPLSSWESRLRERLATVGSTESPLIWREKATPAGRSIFRLAPWTPPTLGRDCIGSRWTTPTVGEAMQGNTTRYAQGGTSCATQMNLTERLATWPTPKASAAGPDFAKIKRSKTGLSLQTMQALSTWPTPIAAANKYRLQGDSQQSKALYPMLIHTDAMVASGQTDNGSPATTTKRGAPNPAFPCWLMGYPAEWLLGAVSATQSIQSSRRK